MIQTKINSKPFIAFKNEGLQTKKFLSFIAKKEFLNDVFFKIKKR